MTRKAGFVALVAGVLLASAGAANAACDQSSANAIWDAYLGAVKCNGPITNGATSLLCTDVYGYQATMKGSLTIKPGCRIIGTLTLVYANGTTYVLPFAQVTMTPNHEAITGLIINLLAPIPSASFTAVRR